MATLRKQKKHVVDSVFNDTPPTWSENKKIKPVKTTWEMIKDTILVSFTLSLPIESMKYYPAKHAVMFGSVAYVVMIAVFVYFLISGYQRQVLQEFISLDKQAGNCHEVKQSLNMRLLATTTGNWETDTDFRFSEASMEFKFNKLEVSTNEFSNLIGGFATTLRTLGDQAVHSPAIINLLYFMHYGTSIDVLGSHQYLVFTATPNDAYNHRHIVTTVGSVDGLCTAASTSWFDVQSSNLVIEWDVPTYDTASCPTIASLESLGWEQRDGDLAVIKIDTISASTAMAVGLDILPSDDLEIVDVQIPVYKDLVMTKRFDPAFPRMRPLFCFQVLGTGENITANMDESFFVHSGADAEAAYRKFTPGAPPICFVDFNGQPGIPVVHHYLPGCRTCDGPTNYSKYNNDHYCDIFDVMIGIIYYPGYGLWTQAVELYFKYPDFKTLSDNTYFPLYDMSNTNPQSGSYTFCDGCKLLGVNIWDNDKYLSPYFHSVSPIHCVDVFSLSPSEEDKLASNPPTKLVEPYYRCKMYPDGAFISAIGIAAGNLGAFGPIAILITVFPLMALYFFLNEEREPEQKYDLVKIMKAQREFIEKVLGANDGTLQGIEKDGIIHKLGVELYNLAEFEEGALSQPNADSNSGGKILPEEEINNANL